MTTYTRKIGMNRGKPRLWLEGPILSTNGFAHRDAWDYDKQDDDKLGPVLDLVRDSDGLRNIAGTAERPIIDINSAAILEGFEGEVTVAVVQPGWLRVTRKEKTQ